MRKKNCEQSSNLRSEEILGKSYEKKLEIGRLEFDKCTLKGLGSKTLLIYNVGKVVIYSKACFLVQIKFITEDSEQTHIQILILN
jgi:hypothetical protein